MPFAPLRATVGTLAPRNEVRSPPWGGSYHQQGLPGPRGTDTHRMVSLVLTLLK